MDSVSRDRIIEIAREQSRHYRIDEGLVLSIIETESSFCPWAVRLEPNWRYATQIDRYAKEVVPRITSETERVLQSMSWGLMQVMGTVAREHGFRDHLTRLVEVELNVSIGCRHLLRLKRDGYSLEDWIASYNSGSPKKWPNGKYVNQNYVDDVKRRWREWDEKLGLRKG